MRPLFGYIRVSNDEQADSTTQHLDAHFRVTLQDAGLSNGSEMPTAFWPTAQWLAVEAYLG